MDINSGKIKFNTFEEAERVASKMQAKHNENFTPYKADGGWLIGGTPICKEKIG